MEANLSHLEKPSRIHTLRNLNDPGEHENLLSEYPDVVKSLSSRVKSWVGNLPKGYIKTDDNEK